MTRKPPEPDFLSRWSERKRKAATEPEPAREAEAEPRPPAPDAEKSEAEILEELGLPDPDTLGPGSDFRAFMQKAVPDQLRRRALRRLWGTNPVLANLDQLVDYGEDFTDSATVVANLQSAWTAGRGYADKFVESAGAEKGDAASETPDEPAATVDDVAGEPEAEPQGAAATAPEATDAGADKDREGRAETAVAEPEEPPGPAPRRRMRFAFGDD